LRNKVENALVAGRRGTSYFTVGMLDWWINIEEEKWGYPLFHDK
jgi:hypothetical protein